MRWFFNGIVPEKVSSGFNDEKSIKQPEREDLYLIFPGSTATGVKFRDDKFEIKSLVKVCGPYLDETIVGNIEIWEKWSCSLEELKAFKMLAQRSGFWQAVKKERIVKNLALSNGSLIEGVDDTEEGCNLELTQLVVNNKNYWTLGYEAFSFKKEEEDLLIDILKKAMHKKSWFSDEISNLNLNLKNSYSYPDFFHKFEGKQR